MIPITTDMLIRISTVRGIRRRISVSHTTEGDTMEGIGWEKGTESGVTDEMSMSSQARSPDDNQGFTAYTVEIEQGCFLNLEHYQAK